MYSLRKTLTKPEILSYKSISSFVSSYNEMIGAQFWDSEVMRYAFDRIYAGWGVPTNLSLPFSGVTEFDLSNRPIINLEITLPQAPLLIDQNFIKGRFFDSNSDKTFQPRLISFQRNQFIETILYEEFMAKFNWSDEIILALRESHPSLYSFWYGLNAMFARGSKDYFSVRSYVQNFCRPENSKRFNIAGCFVNSETYPRHLRPFLQELYTRVEKKEYMHYNSYIFNSGRDYDRVASFLVRSLCDGRYRFFEPYPYTDFPNAQSITEQINYKVSVCDVPKPINGVFPPVTEWDSEKNQLNRADIDSVFIRGFVWDNVTENTSLFSEWYKRGTYGYTNAKQRQEDWWPKFEAMPYVSFVHESVLDDISNLISNFDNIQLSLYPETIVIMPAPYFKSYNSFEFNEMEFEINLLAGVSLEPEIFSDVDVFYSIGKKEFLRMNRLFGKVHYDRLSPENIYSKVYPMMSVCDVSQLRTHKHFYSADPDLRAQMRVAFRHFSTYFLSKSLELEEKSSNNDPYVVDKIKTL